MSESEQQWDDSPLLSERGATKISNTVVSSLAGMAAREVEGVHMGGGASRTASGVLGSITGSESKTSGVSVEVGNTEVAIDLKMGIEYNKNILQTVEEVRRRITDRVQSMTGLRISELNATITDITFPEKEQRRRIGSGAATKELGEGSSSETESDTRTMPSSEPRPVASEETTQVETGGPADAESTSEPDSQVDETAELRTDDTETEEQPASVESESGATSETETPEEPETRAEAEPSEETEAEARRRRRAEERARRRRRTEDG
ncbi:MAG TPA: Asp23/Gls24 family envelope stress response protein [Rubrobacter sp.]|nr:Asp23/Gls24 family envelope stress response protein [Rubrobacter sp.]